MSKLLWFSLFCMKILDHTFDRWDGSVVKIQENDFIPLAHVCVLNGTMQFKYRPMLINIIPRVKNYDVTGP